LRTLRVALIALSSVSSSQPFFAPAKVRHHAGSWRVVWQEERLVGFVLSSRRGHSLLSPTTTDFSVRWRRGAQMDAGSRALLAQFFHERRGRFGRVPIVRKTAADHAIDEDGAVDFVASVLRELNAEMQRIKGQCLNAGVV